MKKILFFLTAAAVILLALKLFSFWPFEKTWANEPVFKKIQLNDNGYMYEVVTEAQTVGDFLLQQKIEIGTEDLLLPGKQEVLTSGINIIIKRSLSVVIKVDGEAIERKTFKATVAEVIAEAGVALSHLDKVTPDKKAALEKNMEIVITRINVEDVTEEEEIDFDTIEKEDPQLKWRKTRIGQEGETGIKEVSYRVTYTNGKQTSKVKLTSSVTKKPVSKIVYNGTKIEVGKVTRGRASWYAYTGTMACASLQFPKGTWLRVTNMDNGKRVIVQVNDSGPYAPDKIIDLDKVAFEKLAPLGAGVANVKVEQILE